MQLHKYTEAEVPLREALSSYEKINPDSWNFYAAQNMLGASLAGQKKFAEAEPLLINGYQGIAQRFLQKRT